jgi:DNA polymerase family A
VSVRVVSLDFELASTLDLKIVGSDVWTRSTLTLPILCGFALDHAEPECIEFDMLDGAWPRIAEHITAHDKRERLLDAVADGAEIHAWNANFEWSVWNNICRPRFSWPKLGVERFHCTMCAAACAGLPMSLDEAAIAVGSPYLKDKIGHALMRRMARPRSDKQGVTRWWHREDPAKLAALIAYNLADVKAEREVHTRIPRMSKRERDIWLVDQRMNARGLPVDGALITALSAITLQELLNLNTMIAGLTKGVITNSTQNARLLEWAQAGGYPHNSLDKDTLFPFLNTPEFNALSDEVREVLLTRAEAAKTSTAKLISIANYASRDGCARNLTQYGAAVRTLRWGGRGPQIHNFPRPVIAERNVGLAIDEILLGADGDTLRLLFGRPLDVVSSCLRGVFKAPSGAKFAIADYHAIEAIVLGWLAEDEPLLDVFRRGEDVYIFTANGVGSSNRQLGKVLRLACGYGMGHVKFQETAASPAYRVVLTLAEAKAAVDAFRQANPLIVSLWHACETSARKAILSPGEGFNYKKLRFHMADPKGRLAGALLMTLPSGRNLVYRNARLENGRIVFWGVDQTTKQWRELDTYGGKLVENATQAVARDLLADAIVELDKFYPDALCTTVHDEIVALTADDHARYLLALMRLSMNNPKPWAKGMPLSAKGAVVERYAKL